MGANRSQIQQIPVPGTEQQCLTALSATTSSDTRQMLFLPRAEPAEPATSLGSLGAGGAPVRAAGDEGTQAVLQTGEQGSSHPEHPSKVSQPCCAAQPSSLPAPQALAPRCAGDSCQGLWLPCFPLEAPGAAAVWRGGNLAFPSGLQDEGILVFQLSLAQGEMYFPSFCGLDPLTAQPLSCFSWDFSYFCCTEQNQSNTKTR